MDFRKKNHPSLNSQQFITFTTVLFVIATDFVRSIGEQRKSHANNVASD